MKEQQLNITDVGSAERLARTPTRQTPHEWNMSYLQTAKVVITYQTQIEIPLTTADSYFQTNPRPLIVFVNNSIGNGPGSYSYVRRAFACDSIIFNNLFVSTIVSIVVRVPSSP